MSQKGIAVIKPLSRFVEHFDMMLPTELLDMIGEEDQQQSMNNKNKNNKKSNKPTPLYALPGFNRRTSSSDDMMNSPEQSPTNKDNMVFGMISPTSPKRKSYLTDLNNSSSLTTTTVTQVMDNIPPIVSHKSNSSSLSAASTNKNNSKKTIIIIKKSDNNKAQQTNNSDLVTENRLLGNKTTSPANEIMNNILKNNNKLSNTPQMQQQKKQDQIYSSSSSNTRKKLDGRLSLNRAEIIIRRYESWTKFIVLLCSWMNDIAKQSMKSEKPSIFKDTNKTTTTITHGFTADLALQKKEFGRHLQTEHIPILEKFRKECTSHIKNLKSRPELNQEEYLKRAEITASLISQLAKTCKEARLTLEKGGQIMNDPWLVNLYVLRQLRGEVNEENRLRTLMVPIQKTIQDFEVRLLQAVENALKACFDKPGALTDVQLSNIQSSLNQAVSNNWSTFAAMHKKDIVNEANPLKHYLNIKYSCKNDLLVMTIHKGQLERRSGVLNNKYTQRFFVITKSGFLHQFKLNDQVSPEYSIYLPKSTTIIPCTDISSLNHFPQEEIKAPKDGFTFEIQRSGSVLQRDKSYVFRTVSFEDMVTWCRLISEVATQSPDSTLQNELFARPAHLSNTTSNSNYSLPLSVDSYHLQQQQPEKIITQPINKQHQQLPPLPPHQQESTPPPSPIQIQEEEPHESIQSTTVIENTRKSEDSMASSFYSLTNSIDEYASSSGRPKLYTPQLNI